MQQSSGSKLKYETFNSATSSPDKKKNKILIIDPAHIRRPTEVHFEKTAASIQPRVEQPRNSETVTRKSNLSVRKNTRKRMGMDRVGTATLKDSKKKAQLDEA